MEHPERVRRQYDNDNNKDDHAQTFGADVRLLLDYLGVQYLDPDVNAAMHRVRKVVGYHT